MCSRATSRVLRCRATSRSQTRPRWTTVPSRFRRHEHRCAVSAQIRRRRVHRRLRRFERGLLCPLGEACARMIDTLHLTAEDAAAMLERGDVSAAELHAAYAACEDDVHAYLTRLDHDGAAGVPIALKDVIGTKGVETTAGS